MFELRCFVEDKNLHKVMWALDGLVAGMPQVLPVRGAKVKDGKVKSTGEGSLQDRLVHAIRTWPGVSIATKTMGKMLIEAGSKISDPMAAGNAATKIAKRNGLLRKGKRRGIWLKTDKCVNPKMEDVSNV